MSLDCKSFIIFYKFMRNVLSMLHIILSIWLLILISLIIHLYLISDQYDDGKIAILRLQEIAEIIPHPIKDNHSFAKVLVDWQFSRLDDDQQDLFDLFNTNYVEAQSKSVPDLITLSQLESAQLGCEARLFIFNNSLYLHPKSRKDFKTSVPVKSNWVPHFIYLIEEIKQLGYQIPEIDFLISTPDQPLCSGPVLSYSRRKDKLGSKVFMLPYFTWETKSEVEKQSRIDHLNIIVPWQDKVSKLFWKGSSTGIRPKNKISKVATFDSQDLNEWSRLTRFKLLLQTKGKSVYNVSLSGIYAETPKFLENSLRPFVTGYSDVIEDMSKFKYLLDVEGNSFSDRLRWLMRSNSLVFKQEYPYIDFISMAFQPWFHYIPITYDLENLDNSVLFAQKRDKLSRKWAFLKSEFAKKWITPEMPILYTYYLLKKYRESMTFRIEKVVPGSTLLHTFK